jgi:hypothetical protein
VIDKHDEGVWNEGPATLICSDGTHLDAEVVIRVVASPYSGADSA